MRPENKKRGARIARSGPKRKWCICLERPSMSTHQLSSDLSVLMNRKYLDTRLLDKYPSLKHEADHQRH